MGDSKLSGPKYKLNSADKWFSEDVYISPQKTSGQAKSFFLFFYGYLKSEWFLKVKVGPLFSPFDSISGLKEHEVLETKLIHLREAG